MTLQSVQMMQLAEREAAKSMCLDRNVGVVVVTKHNTIVMAHNTQELDESNAHHAEAKLVKRLGASIQGAVIYTTCRPCARCTDMLVGKGLKAIYYRDMQPAMEHLQKLRDDGVYLNGWWIKGQLPVPLEQVQQTWAARWQEGV